MSNKQQAKPQPKQRNIPPRNHNRVLRINFDKSSMELPFDRELHEFVKQLVPETASEEDIHVMHAYFQIYWPVKQISPKDQRNIPQVYKGYFVR